VGLDGTKEPGITDRGDLSGIACGLLRESEEPPADSDENGIPKNHSENHANGEDANHASQGHMPIPEFLAEANFKTLVLDPIIYMQCGPIRFHLSARKAAESSPFQHRVLPRFTSFGWNRLEDETTIQDIYAALFVDRARNDLIVQDLVQALSTGHSPLVLTGRTEHLNYLAERLRGVCSHTFILKGGMGTNQRRKLAESLAAVRPAEPRVLLATGSYLGEGFDDPRLDTLFLVVPISWKGTLQQYVGRLHRLHENKSEVQVYDYADVSVPMLARMYKKRLTGYAALGYAISESHCRLKEE
jgi:superfamily II DNA or RNA helicase